MIPLILIVAEGASPPRWEERVVVRSIDIAAPVDRVWPLLFALPRIAPDEGHWTLSQHLLGVPRPVSAIVVGSIRHARWTDGIRFDEVLDHVVPGHLLGWRFYFPDPTLADRTDRHIRPDGPMLKVDRGTYRLDPLPNGGTRLTLQTNYRMRVYAGVYAALWGELILGDIQGNVLVIVADRAEVSAPCRTSTSATMTHSSLALSSARC